MDFQDGKIRTDEVDRLAKQANTAEDQPREAVRGAVEACQGVVDWGRG